MQEHGPAGTKQVDGRWQAHCLCGSFWTFDTKSQAALVRDGHISQCVREAKRLARQGGVS